MRDLCAADLAYSRARARAAAARTLGRLPADWCHDACIDGLLHASRTFDATRPAADWPRWRQVCVHYALLELQRTAAQAGARLRALQQGVTHRRPPRTPRPRLLQWVEEWHDLTVFAAYVQHHHGAALVTRLGAILADERPGEIARATGITLSAYCKSLHVLQRCWTAWGGRPPGAIVRSGNFRRGRLSASAAQPERGLLRES